jgi:hypothetical protein
MSSRRRSNKKIKRYQSLKEDIERDKARIMVDFGGDIPDLLDDQFRE